MRAQPRFPRLKFAPGFWAFTFSWAATASYALEWITLRRAAGAAAYAGVILAAITAFIGYIAARTAVLAARGQLLPPRAVPAKVNAVSTQNGVGDPADQLSRSRD